MKPLSLRSTLVLCAAFASAATLYSQTAPTLTRAEQEEFLRTAKIVRMRPAKKGITGSQRATLTDGRITHDAHIQTIDIHAAEYRTDAGTELNFKDSYKFNIAAYRLDRLLGLGMVPVSVERRIGGNGAAVTWWIDDVLCDEVERRKQRLQAPDPAAYNDQRYTERVFTQLIFNTDPNLTNFVTDKNWDFWMIDFTRAFRLNKNLRNPKDLVKCDRKLLAAMRGLNEEVLTRELHPYLTKGEIEGLLGRRDRIVKFFDEQIAQKGEAVVLCDLKRHTQEPVHLAASPQ